MEDSYWNEKKKPHNIFNDSIAAEASRTPPSLSARPRPSITKTSTPGRSSTIAVPSANPAPTSSRSFSLTGSIDSQSVSVKVKTQEQICLKCTKSFKPGLTTLYEGRAAFEDAQCRTEFIDQVAAELTRGDSLSMYRLKTLSSKRLLVAAAERTNIASAIVRATVYLAAQTSPSIFLKDIRKFHVARSHYLSYLRQLGRFEDAAMILKLVDDPERAMMLRLADVPGSRWTEALALEPCPSDNKFLSLVNKMVHQQVRLNAKQIELESECREKSALDRLDGADVPPWMQKVPVPDSLFDVSLLSTLLYVILFENNPKNMPRSLTWMKEFDIKDSHFRWLRVQALNICGEFGLLKEAITASKGFTSILKSLSRQTNCFIPPQRVARYIHHNGLWESSFKGLSECLRLVSNVSERYEWALELSAWREAVNCAVESRNTEMMKSLEERFRRTSGQGDLAGICASYLGSPVKTWKPL